MMTGVSTEGSISFDRVAAVYDVTRGGLERGVRFAAEIAPFCDSGPVFEIGVGTGVIARPLRDRLGVPVLGADLSPAMLAHAHRRLGATVAVADGARLPVRTGMLGAVVASWVLHLVGDPGTVLEEVRRVLRRGGRLVVVSSRGELEPDEFEGVMFDLHDALRGGGRFDVRDRLVPAARAHGLELDAEVLSGPGTWQESPQDLVERLERRQWGVLIDLDAPRYERIVRPLVEALRALPDPDRPRTRIGRHRLFAFTAG